MNSADNGQQGESTQWQQLRLLLPADQQQAASDLLTAAGALAVTLEEPGDEALYEPLPGAMPLWKKTALVALFPASMDLAAVRRLLENFGEVSLELIAEQEWERAWLVHWQPRCFGERLWVVPSWDRQPREGPTMLLDPGLAFGTGNHPTTALCLQWLAENPPQGQRVVDYGCGSGVLAVAACCLGANHVLAVDIDPQALVATRSNAELNHVTEQVTPLLAEQTSPQLAEPVDLLIANILLQPLCELAPAFAEMLKPGGNLVISGLLTEQAEAVVEIYRPWFEVDHITELDSWIRIKGVRRDE
ncbi:MAG: 50S ribosomal protein L11 methyltransferase [Gammaproteobacteria bacterium]